jgi:hypothetical protein
MPALAFDTSTGQVFEVFVTAGETAWVYIFVPDMLSNPATGATETPLAYWEPLPASMLETNSEGAPAFTSFSYTQGCAWNPDGNPTSPEGASVEYWKVVTNTGQEEQSFVLLCSMLP